MVSKSLSCSLPISKLHPASSRSIGSIQVLSVLHIEFLSSASRWILNLSSSVCLICAESEPPDILRRSLVSVCSIPTEQPRGHYLSVLCATNDPFWTMTYSHPGGFYELVRWHSISQTIYVMHGLLTFDEQHEQHVGHHGFSRYHVQWP